MFKNNHLSDSEVVSEVVNTLLASVEKQVSAEKGNRKRKRPADNNVLDLVMTVEKVSLWKKEFTCLGYGRWKSEMYLISILSCFPLSLSLYIYIFF